MTVSTCTVAIVGAGPYGLAAAAHLRAAGVETRAFGKVMEFWEHNMPVGMCLRSSWDASHISDPHRASTLDSYQAARGSRLPTPLPLANFVDYGHWFQRQAVPDVDGREVIRVERAPEGFDFLLDDGERVTAERVVIATGLAQFANRPPQFAPLPPALASHASDHGDLGRFSGRRVVVIGGGQSAVESAVLLREGGAETEVILRAPKVRWLTRSGHLHDLPRPIRRALYHPTDVGPIGLSQIVARPDLFRLLPRGLQQWMTYYSIRPAASGWLLPRAKDVRITTGRVVTATSRREKQVLLTLDDGSQRSVDHVLLATGYRVDVTRHSLLSPEIVGALRSVHGYPRLADGFESSVPGLHFLGAPAAWSFGPLMRFVSGTDYSARALTRRVVGRAPSIALARELRG